MLITINTAEPISELDTKVLGLLVYNGGSKSAEKPAPKQAEKPAPKKETAPAPKPTPEPEPEPMAEEPVAEEEVVEAEIVDDGEGTSDEELLELAVKKATEMVSSGEAAKVREALDAAGANRVRALTKDNVREFFKALS